MVIVSGPPGTGKTTISRHIADILALPLLQRDMIKETIFDSLGWSDRAWSQNVGIASYRLLYSMMELLLQTRRHFIIESNFTPSIDTPRFRTLQQQYPYRPLQVLCSTDVAVLFERLRRRSLSAERHPGHGDMEDIEKLTENDIIGRVEPLALEGPIIPFDTTSFATLNYTHLAHEIYQHIITSNTTK
jgi:predicted kinase